MNRANLLADLRRMDSSYRSGELTRTEMRLIEESLIARLPTIIVELESRLPRCVQELAALTEEELEEVLLFSPDLKERLRAQFVKANLIT